jgi:hypothetical protein
MEKNRSYRIYFINYKKKGDHVEYIMRLNCIDDEKLFAEFSERYSTLKDLHDVLKKEANSINFPKFPPKKFFGNTDEKFLNKRQTDLQHYFNAILGSKEFSQLPSVKTWVSKSLERFTVKVDSEIYNEGNNFADKPSTTKPIENKQPKRQTIPKPTDEGKFLLNLDNIQRCKDIVDKCSKSFIELGADNGPNFDNDDMNVKERAYKNITCNKGTFEEGDVKVVPNKVDLFENLGQVEKVVAKYESLMNEKMAGVMKLISQEIPERYVIEDLIVSF